MISAIWKKFRAKFWAVSFLSPNWFFWLNSGGSNPMSACSYLIIILSFGACLIWSISLSISTFRHNPVLSLVLLEKSSEIFNKYFWTNEAMKAMKPKFLYKIGQTCCFRESLKHWQFYIYERHYSWYVFLISTWQANMKFDIRHWKWSKKY